MRHEAVDAGLATGHADAAAIETALDGHSVRATEAADEAADLLVLRAAGDAGLLFSNDLALGRRARNLGATWLRTADLIVWLVRRETISPARGRAAVIALRDAGRLTSALAAAYLEEMR